MDIGRAPSYFEKLNIEPFRKMDSHVVVLKCAEILTALEKEPDLKVVLAKLNISTQDYQMYMQKHLEEFVQGGKLHKFATICLIDEKNYMAQDLPIHTFRGELKHNGHFHLLLFEYDDAKVGDTIRKLKGIKVLQSLTDVRTTDAMAAVVQHELALRADDPNKDRPIVLRVKD